MNNSEISPLLWQPLPSLPGLEDQPGLPYSGDSVLLRTTRGAVEGFATLRRVGEKYVVFWHVVPTSIDLTADITHWCQIPEKPVGDEVQLNELAKPALVPGSKYLVYQEAQARWSEGLYLCPPTEPAHWILVDLEKLPAAAISFWTELPLSQDLLEMMHWREKLVAPSGKPEPWAH